MADELPSDPIAVALSGGGYRASLLAIGALLALVDRQLNKRVDVISSVSGGSITNAVVAQSVDYRALEPGDLDQQARALVDSLKWPLVSPISSLVVFGGYGFVAWQLAAAFGQATVVLWTFAVFIVALVLLITPGPLITGQLGSVFHLDRASLASLSGRAIAHEFCATDLVAGLPLTFSSRPAQIRRDAPGGDPAVVETSQLSLAAVVRASAAFPGITPMLLPLEADPTRRLGRLAFCADGGIWNNLGTQAIDNDPSRHAMPVLCVNASALPRPTGTVRYLVPGFALVAALARSAAIMNRNTVEPRIKALNLDLAQWARAPEGRRSNKGIRVAAVADMRPIASATEALADLKVDVGLTSLVSLPWWRDLVGNADAGEILTKTKLTRVRSDEKRRLVLRGYANAWLASMLIQPFEPSELDDPQVARIRDRLETVIGTKRG